MAGKKWPRPPKTTMLCRICGEAKPEEGFAPSVWRTAITRAKCRTCMSSYQLKRYVEWVGKQMSSDRKVRIRMIHKIKSQRGCRECGERHPACLDFHHRMKSEKTLGVGVLVCSSTRMDRILAEVEKCDVLCSNCHRKHHWKAKTAGRPRKYPEIYEPVAKGSSQGLPEP